MQRVRTNLTPIVMALVIALLPVVVSAQAEKKIDVSGKWLFSVNTDAGTGTPTVTFKQQGDTLTGHYSSATLGEADFKGTVKAQKITFSFSVDVQGTTVPVTYAGTVENNDSLKGTVELGGLGTGTFTGKRSGP